LHSERAVLLPPLDDALARFVQALAESANEAAAMVRAGPARERTR
jgi:hypothetical protein